MVVRKIFYLILATTTVSFTVFAVTCCAGQSAGLVAPGAEVKLIRADFHGTEGPATDVEGNVYFSEMFGGRISKWSCADGTVSVYRENLETPNGLMFDAKGQLVICEMSGGRVIVDGMNGNTRLLADACDGEELANPNDVWVAPSGGIYLTVFSMGGGRPGGPPAPGGGMPGGQAPPQGGMLNGAPEAGMPNGTGEQMQGGPAPSGGMPEGGPSGPPGMMSQGEASGLLGIFYISPDGKKISRLLDDISSPNGIIGTPDGKTLYVGDNGEGKMWRYSINPDGTLSNKELFCESASDGMAMDENNNVYLTADRAVLIYSPAGKLIEKIDMPEGCSNVEFCRKDRKTLFITYHEKIYTLEMAIKGAPTALDLATGR